MTILQDLGIITEAGEELVQFESGVVTTLPPIHAANKTWTVSAQKFGAQQPPSDQFPVFSGSIWNVIGLALMDASEIEAGQPVSLAAKFDVNWYGITLKSA